MAENSTITINNLPEVIWQSSDELKKNATAAVVKVVISELISDIPNLMPLLSSDEILRSERYHFAKDKNRFIVTRAVLKLLLGRYLGLFPGDILFRINSNKKPALFQNDNLHFNVSHSNDTALIIIADTEVGIDVEYINPDFVYEDLLTVVSTFEEQKFIKDSEGSREAFYQLWTRKEALIKATSLGMPDDLRVIPGLLGVNSIDPAYTKGRHWQVYSFNPSVDYVAALACQETPHMQFYTVESAFSLNL